MCKGKHAMEDIQIRGNMQIIGKEDKKKRPNKIKEKRKDRSLGCSYPVPTYLQCAMEKSERRSSAQKFLFLSRSASPKETEPSTLREHANKECHKDPSKHGMRTSITDKNTRTGIANRKQTCNRHTRM